MSFGAIHSILLFMIFIIDYISQFLPKRDEPGTNYKLPDFFAQQDDSGC